MFGLKGSSRTRRYRWRLAAIYLLPALALAQSTLDKHLHEVRDISRFVPKQALAQLQALDAEARAAPLASKAEFLALLSVTRMWLGQYDAALLQADELIALGEAQKDKAALAKGLLSKAYVTSAMAEHQSAHALALQAEQIADATGDLPLIVLATITAGEAWAEQGNYPVALDKLQRAVALSRQIEVGDTQAAALQALTKLYTQMKDYDKGRAALDELLKVAAQLKSPGRLALAKNNEYMLAIDTNQPERALNALLDSLQLERALGATGMIAATLVNLSDSYLKRHAYAKAIQFANQAIEAARQTKRGNIEAVARLNIGMALLGQGHAAEGKRSFRAGIAYYEKTGDKPELQQFLLEYGAALERAGELTDALAAYHRERAISNEMFERRRQQAVYELQAQYEAEKKERQIDVLRADNKIQSAEIANRRLQQRVWWLLAVVFALASVIIGLLYHKMRQANAMLKLKNSELKLQSALDPLTGLYNRRHFQDHICGHQPAAPQGCDGDGDIVGALFLLDVDHFKQINDHYGHAAGDRVLKAIAATLREVLRETDMIVRWGGEEFLAFLPALPRAGMDEVAQRILAGISAQRIVHQGRELTVNVSIGFAPFPLTANGAALPWQRAVNLIDMALYLAKADGRNRAYGVRGFHNLHATSLERIERDLDWAWGAGFVDMVVVPGGAADLTARPARRAADRAARPVTPEPMATRL